jgi:tetratricopeptide (TPR) repeat protein
MEQASRIGAVSSQNDRKSGVQMKVWKTVAGSGVLAVLLSPSTSFAEVPADASARAEELFQEGHALLKQARYPESCQRFQASQQIDPASGTLLAFAYCEERAGRLATAFREYTAAVELAAKEQHAERRAAAAERAAALQPRLSTVTVKVPEPPERGALLVRQNGRPLDSTLWGTPVPVDGGRHVIEAEMSGQKTWSVTITVLNEGDHQTVTITAPAENAQEQPRASQARVNATVPAPIAEAPAGKTMEHVALGLAIATAVGAGLGTALALNANAKNNASNSDGRCDERGCDARGMELRNSALSSARLATVAFVVSAGLAAGSVTLFIVAESPPGSSRSAAKAGGWCAGLRGTF